MASFYPWILTLHLACAIVFIGAVTFEVLVLERLHADFDAATMQRIEHAVMRHARRVMPVVVALLFFSGIALFDIRCNGWACVDTRFGSWLLLKVGLALGVLAVFVRTVWALRRGGLNPCATRRTHHVVLTLMVGIVILAKGMFYF